MNDERKQSNDAVWHSLFREVRMTVVNSLLAGNDTQCFTTQQYREAYCRQTHRRSREKDWIKDRLDEMFTDGLATKHLRGLSDAVTEVSPDVWAPAAPGKMK
jgi:hypothetical protein